MASIHLQQRLSGPVERSRLVAARINRYRSTSDSRYLTAAKTLLRTVPP